jgi:hypothetical protein
MFAQKLTAWKFKGYKCVGIENAKEIQERMEAKGLEFGEKAAATNEVVEVHDEKHEA